MPHGLGLRQRDEIISDCASSAHGETQINLRHRVRAGPRAAALTSQKANVYRKCYEPMSASEALRYIKMPS